VLGPVPTGYCWYVERVTSRGSSSGTPSCEIAVAVADRLPAAWDRVGRQDWTGAANNDVGDQVQPIYVGPGFFLIAYWSAANQGDQFTLSTQISVHELAVPPAEAEARYQQHIREQRREGVRRLFEFIKGGPQQ